MELVGQDGISVAPVKEEQVSQPPPAARRPLTNPKGFWQVASVEEYLAEVASAGHRPWKSPPVPPGARPQWVRAWAGWPRTPSGQMQGRLACASRRCASASPPVHLPALR